MLGKMVGWFVMKVAKMMGMDWYCPVCDWAGTEDTQHHDFCYNCKGDVIWLREKRGKQNV